MQKDMAELNLSIYQNGYTKTIVLAKHSGLISEITDTTADAVSKITSKTTSLWE